VGKTGNKPVIGILGGVGSGKSTVAGEFAKLGCAVIDADRIAHELLEEENIKEKIATLFGEDILDSAGRIDHRKLADIVFADADRLAALTGIVHPPVLKRAEELIEQYKRQKELKAIVLDMPLLMEVGWDKRCDKLVFVDCERKVRAERASKTGICSEKQLKIRENFQISLDKKKSSADNTIDNNSCLSRLSRQVINIFSKLIDDG
jgi:dephospho-CoA kinase